MDSKFGLRSLAFERRILAERIHKAMRGSEPITQKSADIRYG